MKKKRVVNVEGQRAYVKSLTPKEKKELGFRVGQHVVSRMPKRNNHPLFQTAMTLANILYPKHFPFQLGSSYPKDIQKTYSRYVPTDKLTKVALKEYYNRLKLRPNERFGGYEKEHSNRVYYSKTRLSKEIYEDSGININIHMANIGVKKNKTLVSFDILSINLELLKKKLNRLRNPTKKKQVLELIKVLEPNSNKNGDILIRKINLEQWIKFSFFFYTLYRAWSTNRINYYFFISNLLNEC